MVCLFLIVTLCSLSLSFVFTSAVVPLDECEKAHKVTNFLSVQGYSLSCFGLGCCYDTSSNTQQRHHNRQLG